MGTVVPKLTGSISESDDACRAPQKTLGETIKRKLMHTVFSRIKITIKKY